VIAIFVVVVRYWDRRAAVRDDAFFVTLETLATTALAAKQFVLASKEYQPKSFGHRFWRFERSPRTIRVYWEGRDREIVVEARDDDSPTPVRERIVIVGPWLGSPPERYQRALDEVLEALQTTVHRRQ